MKERISFSKKKDSEMIVKNPLAEIEKGIEKAESVCDAELVVAFAEMSGPYKDVRFLWGLIGSLFTLIILMFAPINFSPMYLIPNTVLAFGICYWLSLKFPWFIKLLTSERRRACQVKANSEIVWFRRGVSLTKRRTGVLVYVSLLERQGALLCDAGIRQQVPKSVIGKLEVSLRKVADNDEPVSAFGLFLDELAKDMAEYVPEAQDNPDELPNTPIWLKGDNIWT